MKPEKNEIDVTLNETKNLQISVNEKMLGGTFKRLPLNKILQDDNINPRNAGAFDHLIHIDSIVRGGIRYPIIMSKREDGTYMVICGNLRKKAIDYMAENAEIVAKADGNTDHLGDTLLTHYDAYKRHFSNGIPCQIVSGLTLAEEKIAANDFDRAGRSLIAIMENMVGDFKHGFQEADILSKYGPELLTRSGLTPEQVPGYADADTFNKRIEILRKKYRGHCQVAKCLAVELPPVVMDYYRNSENKTSGPVVKYSQIRELSSRNKKRLLAESVKRAVEQGKPEPKRLSPAQYIGLTTPTKELTADINALAGVNAGTGEKPYRLTEKIAQDKAAGCISTTVKALVIALIENKPLSAIDKVLLDLEKAGKIPTALTDLTPTS